MDRSAARTGRTARLMARIALPIVAQLEESGADADAVLARAGLRRDQLEDPDRRIDHERWVALLEIGAHVTEDPDFGLHAAEQLSRGRYAFPALFIESHPTLADGLGRLEQYFRVVHEGMRVGLIVDGDRARCRIEFLPGLAYPRVLAEHMMAFGSVLGVQLLGEHGPRPLQVRIAHVQPTSTSEHLRVLRGPVVFGVEHTEFVFDLATLSLPIASANPHLSALLEDEARRLVARLPADDTVAGRCVAWIRGELHAGREPRLAAMAREIHMGERTLRRRLEGERATFRDLIDEVREEIARVHVAAGRLSVDEIALVLGYSEAVAFRRAFRRWTGLTPSAYRRAERPGPSPSAGSDSV